MVPDKRDKPTVVPIHPSFPEITVSVESIVACKKFLDDIRNPNNQAEYDHFIRRAMETFISDPYNPELMAGIIMSGIVADFYDDTKEEGEEGQ